MSGVKNLVSNTGALLRGEPFNQVKSPKANGVKLSTPSAASGEWRASGTDWASGAAGLGLGASQSADQSDEVDLDLAVATGSACSAGFSSVCAAASAGSGAEAGAGTFITRSCRVALLATTCSEGAVTSGYPSTCAVTDHTPGGRSAKE